MAKTYTFNVSACKGGALGGAPGSYTGDWNNFTDQGSNRTRVGRVGYYYYAVYYVFGTATDGVTTYAAVRNKTITSVKLKVPIKDVGTGVPSTAGGLYPIRAKASGATSGGEAWKNTGSNLGEIAGTVSSGFVTITLTNSLPANGYTIGPGTYYENFVELGTAAVLTVVTNETDYTLSYNANGGSGAPGSQVGTAIGSGSASLVVSSTVPSWTGYDFLGWSTSSTATTASYVGGNTISISSNTTLYAVWRKKTYIVSYNKGSNGTGTNTSDTKTYGVALTLKGAIFTRTGYRQTGWATSDGGSQAYALSASYTANAAVTLYPVWTIITYTVSYDANGGSGAPSAQTKTYGVALTLSSTIPTRSGYIFQGWATSATGTATYRTGTNHDQNISYTANASVVLYAVWQAAKSTLTSAPNTYIGNAITVTWTNAYSAIVNKLKFVFGNVNSGEISVSGTSHSYTIPTSWLNQIPNATSGTATVYLYSYVGSTLVGTDSKTFTASAKSTVVPSIGSITATKVNPQWNLYLQKYSKVTIAVSGCAAGAGATIQSYSIVGQGISYAETTNATSASATSAEVFATSGTFRYTATITDSRGRTAQKTIDITVTPYAEPAISNITAVRSDSNGTVNQITGTSIKATSVFTWSAVGSNALTTTLSYKKHSASSYTQALTTVVSGTSYVIAANLAEIASSYDVKLEIVDSLNNKATYTVVVPPVVGIAFGLKNDRARFGGPVEKAGLQVDWDAEFNGVVDITPRRCYATLSSSGWYRVLRYKAVDSGDVRGGWGLVVDFNIQRVTSSENHSITMRCTSGGNFSFVNESSKSFWQCITKIRYTYDSTNLIAYVDIYYNTSDANMTGVDFTVHGPAFRTQSAVTAESLQSVADSPSGETVLTEYSFSANTEADGSVVGASGFTPDEIDIKRSGRVVYVHFYVQNVSIAANTETLIGTLSGVPFPKKNIRWLAGGGAHAYDTVTPVYAILGASGNIYVTSPSAISAVNITISYIV